MVALDQDEDQEGATILKLLLLTGARSAEMLKMEWSQLDLDGGVWTKPHTATKQKEEHIVPLGDEALTLLRCLPKKGRYVFGTFQPRKNVRLIWERVRAAAGIEDVRIHDLRHTYASTARQSPVTPAGDRGAARAQNAKHHCSVCTRWRCRHEAGDQCRHTAEEGMTAIWKRTGEIVTVQGTLSDGMVAIETGPDSDWAFMPYCVTPTV